MVTSAAGGSGTGVQITLLGSPGKRHHIQQLTWSYNGAPTGGRIYTVGLQGTELDFDVTAAGPGGIALPPGSYGRYGSSVDVIVAGGGGSVVAKINIFSELE